MTQTLTNCPNCQTKLKDNLLGTNLLLTNAQIDIINEFHETKSSSYCYKCGGELLQKYQGILLSEFQKAQSEIQQLLSFIPIITLQQPLNWEYEVLGMVTGQSTTGTGVLSELTSSFTDLLGAQSNRYNKKLKQGEELCFGQLRKQVADMGGNAIIATDIDYSEVGGDKGMLMVCMAGTGIRLKNSIILGENVAESLEKIPQAYARLKHLASFDTGNNLLNN